jgi:hypothetical protein
VNVSEVISSGLLESYILGTTTAGENALIQDLCTKHPELIKEIEAIEKSLIRFSEQAVTPLDPKLKEKIMAGLAFKSDLKPSSPEKIIPLQKQENSSRLNLYRFAMAASLLLFVTSFVYNILLQKQLSRLNGELAELSALKALWPISLTFSRLPLAASPASFTSYPIQK